MRPQLMFRVQGDMMRTAPSLVDLCVQLAIDNVRYLGNVGETDFHLLERILSHCTLDQLMHIENCTEGRDLSPVTDKLWKRFYKVQFGAENTDAVVERMRQRKVTFKWRQLYEAKEKEREEATQKSLDRIRQRYQEEVSKKQSRQVQLCTKVPPSSRKRNFCGGAIASNIYSTKSGIMKKAKLDFVNSREFKNIAAIKNKTLSKNTRIGVPFAKTSGLSSPSSSWSSKQAKPMQRRFS